MCGCTPRGAPRARLPPLPEERKQKWKLQLRPTVCRYFGFPCSERSLWLQFEHRIHMQVFITGAGVLAMQALEAALPKSVAGLMDIVAAHAAAGSERGYAVTQLLCIAAQCVVSGSCTLCACLPQSRALWRPAVVHITDNVHEAIARLETRIPGSDGRFWAQSSCKTRPGPTPAARLVSLRLPILSCLLVLDDIAAYVALCAGQRTGEAPGSRLSSSWPSRSTASQQSWRHGSWMPSQPRRKCA